MSITAAPPARSPIGDTVKAARVYLPSSADPGLSQREVEVLVRWLRGEAKSQIVQQLFISVSTVNTYLARIRDKYAAVDRPATTKTALLVRALQDRLICLDDL